jgi:hypothetical protein
MQRIKNNRNGQGLIFSFIVQRQIGTAAIAVMIGIPGCFAVAEQVHIKHKCFLYSPFLSGFVQVIDSNLDIAALKHAR